MKEAMVLDLGLIEADEDLQPRCKTDRNVSHEYGLAMARGAVFPPIDVFWDGETYWLADGFHRLDARRLLGLADIDCIVHQGSYDEALWFTCSANASHGLHRSREDVRFAIRRALLHAKSAGWSDVRISDHVGCSPKTVGAVRAEMVAAGEITTAKVRIGKDGRSVDVSGIGAVTPEIPEWAEPGPSVPAQSDIEDVPGVKPSGKVTPLIDPAWAHLSEQIHAVVKAHGRLPGPGVAAANYPDVLAHSLSIEDVEAIANWWAGFVPLWRARQPEIRRYIARIKALGRV